MTGQIFWGGVISSYLLPLLVPSQGLLSNKHCLTEAAVLVSGCGKVETKASLKEELAKSNLLPKHWLTLASKAAIERIEST